MIKGEAWSPCGTGLRQDSYLKARIKEQLDQIWGTRDFLNPKYVMEAGTSKSPNLTPSSTPAYSPSPSIADPSESSNTCSALVEYNSDTESEFDKNSPLSRAMQRPRGQKRKGPSRGKAKSDKAANCDDEELRFAESLFFKKKRKQPAANSKDGNKKSRKRDKKEDEQGKEEEKTFTELMKAQVEAMKKAEEKKQLFDYLRQSGVGPWCYTRSGVDP